MRIGTESGLTAADTHGILLRPEHEVLQSSDSLEWQSFYASHQREAPYADTFGGNDHHLIIVHLNGPVRIRRELSGERREARIGTGGLFILPAQRDFGVALMSPLETVHLYVHRKLIAATVRELCDDAMDSVEFLPRMGEHDPLLEQLARLACTMIKERQSDLFADSVARLIAAQLVRHHALAKRVELPRITGLQPSQIARVRALVAEKMEAPISVDDLARAANLSPIHFARQFKRSTGRAPYQYIIEQRVERARDLLRGDLPIAEIAVRCGFTHQEHLTRIFGRTTGVTPAAYRRSLR
ncbi:MULTISPECIES: helix-turn-helix domain-containing protein [unclassified Novosphingobium]|uniref:helix-turn-helix domain-containing protein n=1 Tax=unclassified Novosphingobium TaxID=2644732 RepID=UPI00145A0816|nr:MULTISPECIES: helix-turn-helix transcriptional regulator [unclassified Novosphingobium]MBB3360484.1 AraC family transcriptional regulator [Novosphingobium sp. BK256]MBB3376866.1 AraC family transcriptional regulator [Novosphingobium sp. BK280]MBB3381260.1 AraC family transcriptional regulator [Novosphingobium sp. BK258]MBB3422928.1 AraC family transcriptional regulator [Novosphingobium sp. BK267]MBB3451630.1 AraC family transcriptional regulator [Novosphingobium sp. BK352]